MEPHKGSKQFGASRKQVVAELIRFGYRLSEDGHYYSRAEDVRFFVGDTRATIQSNRCKESKGTWGELRVVPHSTVLAIFSGKLTPKLKS